jgi:hypothetical protein
VGQAVPYTADQLAPEFQKVLYKGGCDGIFLQPDPIWDVNLYPYVANNPIILIDPYGNIKLIVNPDLMGASATLMESGAIVAGGGAVAISTSNPAGVIVGGGMVVEGAVISASGFYTFLASIGIDPFHVFPQEMVPNNIDEIKKAIQNLGDEYNALKEELKKALEEYLKQNGDPCDK